MSDEITNIENEEVQSKPGNTINCPDCEKEYSRPNPGPYKCSQCFCKFIIEPDQSLKIVPFFDEMNFQPIMVMLLVLGTVLLVAMGDKYLPFMQRLNFFLLFVAVVYGSYKLSQFLCRRYRGVDRFFRSISRPRFIKDPDSLIDLSDQSEL